MSSITLALTGSVSGKVVFATDEFPSGSVSGLSNDIDRVAEIKGHYNC
jgi:hypothetical protein